jgi:fido (protein-threonine AMPylation protein)
MNKIKEIIKHSNWVEAEYSDIALEDAMRAWKFAKANMDKIDIDYILKIHYLLSRHIMPQIAGKFRDCDVWIGGKRKWFISEALLKDELRQVIALINVPNFKKGMEEEYTKHCHVLFEAVHPFCDGNGRVGRILFNIHRLKLGLKPLLIEGPAKGKPMTQSQFSYYLWFR